MVARKSHTYTRCAQCGRIRERPPGDRENRHEWTLVSFAGWGVLFADPRPCPDCQADALLGVMLECQ